MKDLAKANPTVNIEVPVDWYKKRFDCTIETLDAILVNRLKTIIYEEYSRLKDIQIRELYKSYDQEFQN